MGHPSVQRLLAEEDLAPCPRAAIRHRASRIVSEAISMGWEGPPFDMKILASLRGMKVQVVDGLTNNQDGFLLPGSPPVINISSSIPEVRARFTLAHEIIHSILPDTDSPRGDRYWVYRHEAQSPVEQLCQVGAGELLMPSAFLNDYRTGRLESLELAEDVRKAFNVSLEAAARNLVDIAPCGCAMIILQLMNKPSEVTPVAQLDLPGLDGPEPEKRLRILYACTSRSWDDHYFPPHKSVPEGSVAYAALQSPMDPPVISEGIEDWSDIGGVGRCFLQAVRIWRQSEPTVLCLLREVGVSATVL